MKAFKVTYSHGHFIDKESNLRIIPVQGAELIITATPESFTTEDSKLKIDVSLSKEEKRIFLEKKYGKEKIGKILDANARLFFRVGNSKTIKGDESREYVFICSLLEDLYLYKVKGRSEADPENWRLADCKCVLEKCLLGGLTLTEKIPADSLNKLFSHVVMFYFSMQRAASANVFNTFFIYEQGVSITFDSVLRKRHRSLNEERIKFVQKREDNNT